MTPNEEEATWFEASGEEDSNIVLHENVVFTTGNPETIELGYEGTTYAFTKIYNYGGSPGGNMIVPSEELTAAPGYILTETSNWDDHQRWAWLFINGLGWIDESE
ncbi:MAG: hypothetical protein Q4F41_03990 [Eubacteriales bacterium]|nr:hypothetical protein [Eubacteriales bacterium]